MLGTFLNVEGIICVIICNLVIDAVSPSCKNNRKLFESFVCVYIFTCIDLFWE